MDIQKMIVALREERACLDEALMGLEKLASKRAPRRGRPPAWMKPAMAVAAKSEPGMNGSTNGKSHHAFSGN
jgi:hypothetical protein